MSRNLTLDPRPAAGQDSEVELFSVAGNDGFLHEVNDRFARLLGVDPSELNDHSILELVHPDDVTGIVAGLAALSAGETEVLLENRFKQQDGGWLHLQWVARPMPGTDLWWAAGRDTTMFHRLLAEGVDLRARLDLAIGHESTAMWELDIRSGRFSWEQQAASVLGLSVAALPADAAALAQAVDPEDAPTVLAAVRELVEVGNTDVAVRVSADTGTRYLSLRGKVLDRDRRGKALRAVGMLFDVTSERAMEEQMLRMIMSDALTGAPNRRCFDQTLRSEWRRCTRAGQPLSTLMIDIDDFKKFNDTFGHLVGDQVLCAVSRALSANLHRGGDCVARFGGEEFAVALVDVDRPGALTVANRLVAAIRAVSIRQAPGWTLSVSIGTATMYPEDPQLTAAELLLRADQALYEAKRDGKNRAVSYEDSLGEQSEFENTIRTGLASGEFELYYQPIVGLQSAAVTGFEALMRWNRPGHGLVGPDDFIPVAEKSTLVCELGLFALETATQQLATWHSNGVPGRFRVAVNASGRHIAGPRIVADITEALAHSGLPPHRLELELTETALVDGADVDAHLAQVRALGVSVSLDDFGTGYTSVGQLPHLPVDTLKVDRSFVISTDPRQATLVVLMVAAAHAFDLSVVAEGIEDTDTLHRLRALGCDEAQGYIIARPMPADAVPGWLSRWSALSVVILGDAA